MSTRGRSPGMSLIEVVVFLVVLGIGLVGIFSVFNQVTRGSVDPMVRKQTLAIAAALLEEIELRPFTFCDPDDPNVFTATGPPATGCTTNEGIGTEGGETRHNANLALRFDNVSDYHGFCMGPGAPVCSDTVIRTAAGPTISELANYRVDVTVAEAGADLPNVAAGTEGLLITVTAIHQPTGITTSLQGYRLRYAPNSP
jgi:MSHA pilin protein MshD